MVYYICSVLQVLQYPRLVKLYLRMMDSNMTINVH